MPINTDCDLPSVDPAFSGPGQERDFKHNAVFERRLQRCAGRHWFTVQSIPLCFPFFPLFS